VSSWACATIPARLPAWMPWEFSWPEYLAATLALLCYARGLRATPIPLRPGRRRQWCFVAGTLLTYAVLQTRFDYLAQHMFTLTRVQHLVTHHVGPFLIALAWPGEVLLRGMPDTPRRACCGPWARRAARWAQQPVIAGVLFVGLVFFFLIPAVQFRAMIDHRLYALMNWSMVIDGILFWALILDPRPAPPARLSYAARLLLVFAVQWPQIAGGALIGFADGVLYPYYALCGRVFPAIGDLADQQMGGFVIWFGGGMMSAAAVIILLRALWREEHRLAAAS
jgi:putative membrane protein